MDLARCGSFCMICHLVDESSHSQMWLSGRVKIAATPMAPMSLKCPSAWAEDWIQPRFFFSVCTVLWMMWMMWMQQTLANLPFVHGLNIQIPTSMLLWLPSFALKVAPSSPVVQSEWKCLGWIAEIAGWNGWRRTSRVKNISCIFRKISGDIRGTYWILLERDWIVSCWIV